MSCLPSRSRFARVGFGAERPAGQVLKGPERRIIARHHGRELNRTGRIDRHDKEGGAAGPGFHPRRWSHESGGQVEPSHRPAGGGGVEEHDRLGDRRQHQSPRHLGLSEVPAVEKAPPPERPAAAVEGSQDVVQRDQVDVQAVDGRRDDDVGCGPPAPEHAAIPPREAVEIVVARPHEEPIEGGCNTVGASAQCPLPPGLARREPKRHEAAVGQGHINVLTVNGRAPSRRSPNGTPPHFRAVLDAAPHHLTGSGSVHDPPAGGRQVRHWQPVADRPAHRSVGRLQSRHAPRGGSDEHTTLDDRPAAGFERRRPEPAAVGAGEGEHPPVGQSEEHASGVRHGRDGWFSIDVDRPGHAYGKHARVGSAREVGAFAGQPAPDGSGQDGDGGPQKG